MKRAARQEVPAPLDALLVEFVTSEDVAGRWYVERLIDAVALRLLPCAIAAKDHLGGCRHKRHDPDLAEQVKKAVGRLLRRRVLYRTHWGGLVAYSTQMHAADLRSRRESQLAQVEFTERQVDAARRQLARLDAQLAALGAPVRVEA
jgi:hypothetical protein